MSDWQERITRETAPAIRVEHELRYLMASPLVLPHGPWIDLGCGNGIAARAAFGDATAVRAVLVDFDEDAVAHAARELGLPDAQTLTADLTQPDDLQRLWEQAAAFAEPPVVTCFEVLEHLGTFLPLLEWVGRVVQELQGTFLMSVPNDAFWSIQNPHHASVWGEGAFAELRSLLPADVTLLRQVPLAGSALAKWDGEGERYGVEVELADEGQVASHFIVAWGPRAGELRRDALIAPVDMLAQRAWERQRESELAVAEQLVQEQAAEIREQHEDLRQRNIWFEEWRRYIHELERELGKPLSGVAREDPPPVAHEENPVGGADASGQTSASEPPADPDAVARTGAGPAGEQAG